MTALAPSGFLRIGAADLEYRMIGPAPEDAPIPIAFEINHLKCVKVMGSIGRATGR